jgi:N-carbamoylputrescine amidase
MINAPSATELRVAAVQALSLNGEGLANLARAEPLVAEAAGSGARLVLCPEFLAAGYIYDEVIWRSGESRGGLTETWLSRQAAAHEVYLGATYLEAEDEDFYNTFALAGPDGAIAGRVRKQSLPGFEGWYFRSSEGPKFIDTDLGRIGVGICQDNHTARFFHHVERDRPDLIVMPHSAPCMPLGAGLMRRGLKDIPRWYADSFGVPVVLANKARSHSTSPIPLLPLVRLPFDFPGLSSICDSDGRSVAQLSAHEGVAMAVVSLDPARKKHPAAPTGRYWSRRPGILSRPLGAGFLALERLGAFAYRRSRARPCAARAASGL